MGRRTVLFGLLLLAAGAGRAGAGPGETGDSRYFPLRTGDRWEYQVEDLKGHTRERMEVVVRGRRKLASASYEVTVVEERRAGDAKEPGAITPVVYFAEAGFVKMRNDFAYRNGTLEIAVSGYTPRSILPLRLDAGRTWQETTYTSDGEVGSDNPTRCDWAYRVIGIDAVEVPAGRFADAVKVQSTARHKFFTYAYDDWYAPGVGLVRSITRHGTSEGEAVLRLDLLSFERAAGSAR